ncbi:MAG: sigma-70 family RNA polymerase sigma factor [Gemmatimonadales bacterium]
MPDIDVTQLLVAYADGERQALDRLMPVLYDELRRIAHRHLGRQETGHTLTTTALVHEVYLKLVDAARVRVRDRAHFFAMASRAMRQILIDHARGRLAIRRGGGQVALRLDEAIPVSPQQADRLLALDDALERLERRDARRCRLVEYRYFAGLTLQETADVLGVSLATVKREWTVTRAWLNRELGAGHATGS